MPFQGQYLTTNTSTYMASEIEDVVRRGDRFAAMHFHLGTPLVDVVAGPRTSPVDHGYCHAFCQES